jgi:hypothetical protein
VPEIGKRHSPGDWKTGVIDSESCDDLFANDGLFGNTKAQVPIAWCLPISRVYCLGTGILGIEKNANYFRLSMLVGAWTSRNFSA